MAIAASAPVLPNQKKQCCKIARFTDAPCITDEVQIHLTGQTWNLHESELKTETLRKTRVLPLNCTNGVKARTSHRQPLSKLIPFHSSTNFPDVTWSVRWWHVGRLWGAILQDKFRDKLLRRTPASIYGYFYSVLISIFKTSSNAFSEGRGKSNVYLTELQRRCKINCSGAIFKTLNQQNAQCSSLDVYIILWHSVFLHVSVLKGSSSGSKYKITLHNT